MAKISAKHDKLPEFLRPYFWDVDFDKMDPDKHPNFVIARVLDWGETGAVEWLKKRYPKQLIADTLMHYRDLSKRSGNFWSLILDINPYQVACLQTHSHPILYGPSAL